MVALPFPWDYDDPIAIPWLRIWECLQGYRPWKRLVARALRKHILQERIARDVASYHSQILDQMRCAGYDVWLGVDPPDEDDLKSWRCHACDRTFATKQALAAHDYQRHQQCSLERPYIQSTTCAGCLRDFHTTWRVQQHLRYRANGCWDRLHGAKQPDEPATISLPERLRFVKRLPAIRRLHGPLRPTSQQRNRIQLSQRIADLKQKGVDEFAWWHPESAPDLVQRAFQVFARAFGSWCTMNIPDEISFQNLLFNAIFALPVSDLQGGRIFVHWIETRFYDEWPPDLDPDMAECAERAYMLMLDDIPAWTLRLQMKHLLRLWQHLPCDGPVHPARAPVLRDRPYCRTHLIESLYSQLGVEEQQRSDWKLLAAPPRRSLSTTGPFYVVLCGPLRRRHDGFSGHGGSHPF